MKKLCLIFLIILLIGCGSFRTATMYKNDYKDLPRTNPNKIKIYLSEEDSPKNYKELGLIVTYNKITFGMITGIETLFAIMASQIPTKNHVNTPMFDRLIYKAANLGANGVIIKNLTRLNEFYVTLTGVAIIEK